VLSVVRPLRQSAFTGSNMAAGFQRLYNDVFTVSRGSRPSAAKYVIVLTDGTTSRDPEDTQYHVTVRHLSRPGLPWIWNFPSISASISTDFSWISMG